MSEINYLFGFFKKQPIYFFGFFKFLTNYLFGFFKFLIFAVIKSISYVLQKNHRQIFGRINNFRKLQL